MSTEHPNGVELELVACGEGSAEARTHVESCAVCTQYVASLQQAAGAFMARSPAEKFVASVEARAEKMDDEENVRPFARLLRTRLVWAAAPLAAAAIVLLMARPALMPQAEPTTKTPETPTTAARETTFKGGFVVAIVRERGGAQDRVVGDIDVRPFDRLRLEVSVDGPTPLAAGALADDGTWVPLIVPTMFDGGTFFSEHSLRFDETPSGGVIIVGEPTAIERARATRELSGVRVLRMRSSPR